MVALLAHSLCVRRQFHAICAHDARVVIRGLRNARARVNKCRARPEIDAGGHNCCSVHWAVELGQRPTLDWPLPEGICFVCFVCVDQARSSTSIYCASGDGAQKCVRPKMNLSHARKRIEFECNSGGFFLCWFVLSLVVVRGELG